MHILDAQLAQPVDHRRPDIAGIDEDRIGLEPLRVPARRPRRASSHPPGASASTAATAHRRPQRMASVE